MTMAGSIGSIGNVAMSFLPVYFTSLGGSVTQYGIVTALGMLVGIPSTIFGGVIVPRHGLKRVAILTSWFGPCILLGYYFSKDWLTLSIIMTLGAAGTIGSSTSRQIIADATIAKNRTAQLSIYQTISNIPAMFSPVIGGYLVSTMGIVAGFQLGALIAIGTSFLSTFLLVKFLRESKKDLSFHPLSIISSHPRLLDKDQKQERKIEYILRRLAPKRSENDKVKSDSTSFSLFLHFKSFFRNVVSLPKTLAPLVAAYILVAMANSTTGPYYIFYATDIAKLDTFHWGLILTLQVIFANMLRTPLGMIADRFDKRKVLLLSLAMTAPLSTILVLLNSFWGILGVSLAMIATGIHYSPTHEALQIELTPREKRPALFAIYDVLTNLSKFIGVITGGVLFAFSYALPFYAFTIIEVCAFVILVAAFLKQRTLSLHDKKKHAIDDS